MSKPTPEQFAKLPKWASGYIAEIEGQRDGALEMIKKFDDSQTESPFFLDEWYCEPRIPRIRRYIQSPTKRIQVEHSGIHLGVFLASERDGQREFGIELQYSSIAKTRLGISSIAIVPTGTNTIALVHKDNMR